MSAETSSLAEDASSATFTTAPGAADYDAIFAAVVETDRGRWFLTEYARRNRQTDTAEVLAAIDRLAVLARSAFAGRPPDRTQGGESSVDVHRLRIELAHMAKAIARTNHEIASIRPGAAQGGRIMEATEQPDPVALTTERATSDIMAAAKQVQEVAWTMREQGMESQFCDRLDGYASEIYTACSLQDLTGQRTRKIIKLLRYLEARIQGMTDIWGAAVQPRPPANAVAAELPSRSGNLSRNVPDRSMSPCLAPPAVKSPVVESAAAARRAIAGPPAKAPKSTVTIEGPAGSLSILAERTVERADLHAVTGAVTSPPVDPDRLTAGLRAFAANFMAEYRKNSAAPQVAAKAPPNTAASPATAPAPIAIEPLRSRQPEIVLPLAVAPPLGDPPRHPAPGPVTQKSDFAEDLFADVMALTDEERIALFT